MMDQLGLTEGELVSIENKSLPSATYAKFKPLSTDFLHISNPRAMLEVELRKFACLTKNDTFAVRVIIFHSSVNIQRCMFSTTIRSMNLKLWM